MDKPAITYATRSDAAPEAERDALVTVYRYILDCQTSKKLVRSDHRDEAHERTGTPLIHDEGRST